MATSNVGSLLARLGCADPAVLAKAPSQTSRFIQMGLVLLSTAGLAAVSMAFAMNDALKFSSWAAALIGLGWGAVILNLDRLLILTMKPTNSKWAIFGMVAPRIVMAALLGIVIATPLTLRIFDSEITTQIAFDQARSAETLGTIRDKDPQRAELDTLNTKIAHYEDILAGRVQYSTPVLEQARSDLKAAQDTLNTAQTAFDTAYCKYSHELYGGTDCGASGTAGTGDLTNTAKGALDTAGTVLNQARADVQQKQAALDQAQDSSKAASSDKLAADQRDANTQLPALRDQRTKIQDNLNKQTLGDAGSIADPGILSKIEALNHLADASIAARLAHYAVAGLLFMIELLPVLVKTMSFIGPTTVYDRVSDLNDKITIDDANQQRSNDRRRVSSEEVKQDAIGADMEQHEIRLGKKANKRVADEMEVILDVALQNWSKDVRQSLHMQSGQVPPNVASPPPRGQQPPGPSASPGPGPVPNGQTAVKKLNLGRWWKPQP